MENFVYALCIIISFKCFHVNKGQFIQQEELRNKTTCGLHINTDVTCGSDGVIAIQSISFYYHPTCESTCCVFDSSHYRAVPENIVVSMITRSCSGKTDCSIEPLDGVRSFEDVGPKPPSYVVILYYCIPPSKITTMCSENNVVSAGEPVYLTNKDYPLVPTGDNTCSCSIEVYSCTSRINLYIIDADMYNEVDTCEQNIDFLNGKNSSLEKIDCQNYYRNEIVSKQFSTIYIKINFNDNSVKNSQGYFFIGFDVTEEIAFKLSCSFEEQKTCKDCGSPGAIQNGLLQLVEAGNSGFGALAKVECKDGYESKDMYVACLDTGEWNTTSCKSKDCGAPGAIQNGQQLDEAENSGFGSLEKVECKGGYESKDTVIIILICVCGILLVIIACLLIYIKRIRRLHENSSHEENDRVPDAQIFSTVSSSNLCQPVNDKEKANDVSVNEYERLHLYEFDKGTGEMYQQLEIAK